MQADPRGIQCIWSNEMLPDPCLDKVDEEGIADDRNNESLIDYEEIGRILLDAKEKGYYISVLKNNKEENDSSRT